MGFSFSGTPSTSQSFSFGGSSGTSAASSGFSFGGTAAAPTGSSTSLFGSTSTPASSSSSLFGSSGGNTGSLFNTSAAPSSSSSFSFGGTAAASRPHSASFSFGGTSSTTPSSSNTLFGSFASTPTTNSTSGNLFGSTGTSSTSSLFGSTSSSSLFGAQPQQQQQQQQQSSLFGQSATGPTSTFGSFGGAPAAGQPTGNVAPSGGGFGTLGLVSATGPTAPVPALDSPLESLAAIILAYRDPQQSRFKHMVYNVVNPQQRAQYLRPPFISEKLWKQAESDNPDPANCVPAAVVGFDQLQERLTAQQQHADKLKSLIQDLRKIIRKLEASSRATDAKIESCRVEHMKLAHRMIEVMRKVEVLQCLRKPLHVEESRLRNVLEHLVDVVNQPTQFKGKLKSLIALQRAKEENPRSVHDQLAEEDLYKIRSILGEQREGMKELHKILERDLRDVDIINSGLNQRHVRTF